MQSICMNKLKKPLNSYVNFYIRALTRKHFYRKKNSPTGYSYVKIIKDKFICKTVTLTIHNRYL